MHSFKDLPTKSPPELTIGAVPQRVDPADLLLVRRDALAGTADDWLPLKAGARVGTASARRRAWLKHFRSDLAVEPLRGNVPTRVRRLEEGMFDAIVLAAAGVERLQAEQRLGSSLADVAVLRLDPARFVAAPAQGALAVQCRRDDARVLAALAQLDHAPTRAAVTAGTRRARARRGRLRRRVRRVLLRRATASTRWSRCSSAPAPSMSRASKARIPQRSAPRLGRSSTRHCS